MIYDQRALGLGSAFGTGCGQMQAGSYPPPVVKEAKAGKVKARATRPSADIAEAEVNLTMSETDAKFLAGLLVHVRLIGKISDSALRIFSALKAGGIERTDMYLEGYAGPFTTNKNPNIINNTKLDGTIVVKEK